MGVPMTATRTDADLLGLLCQVERLREELARLLQATPPGTDHDALRESQRMLLGIRWNLAHIHQRQQKGPQS